MQTVAKYLGFVAVAGLLAAGPAFAQAAKPATPMKAMPKERSAISIKCSKDADAKKLHGKERKKFRADCMKAGKM